MIHDIHFSLLEAEELSLLAGRLRELGEKSGIHEGVYLRLLTALKADEELMRKVLNRNRVNQYTRLLQEKDEIRDRAFIMLRDFIRAFTNAPAEEIRGQALKLEALIARQGNSLHLEGQARETALLQQLFAELDTPENQAALEGINALPYYRDLVARAEDFERTYGEKLEAEGAKDLPRLAFVRDRLTGHLNALVVLTNLLCEQSPGTYDFLARQINEGAGEIMSQARARQTRNRKEDAPGA